MAQARQQLEFPKQAVAVALTFVAGYVDAVGWLALDRVFTAQMSGNIVLLAVHIVAGERQHILIQADAMAAFFCGLVVTGGIIEVGMRQRVRRIFVAALAVEALMLAAFALAGSTLAVSLHETETAPALLTFVLVAVVSFAMGAQNTSLRMAGILSVFTTHMTGAMTGLSEDITVCVLTLLSPRRRRAHGGFISENLRRAHPQAVRNIARSTALIIGFFAGAFVGATLAKSAGIGVAMIVPLALLGAIGIFNWMVPLTVFSASERKT